jgi:hypothetical protein
LDGRCGDIGVTRVKFGRMEARLGVAEDDSSSKTR